MHVALYSPSWPLAQYPNGVVTYVHWMREELLRQGHRVSIFTGVLGRTEAGVYLVAPSFFSRLSTRIRGRLKTASAAFSFAIPIAEAIETVHRHTPIDVIEMEESFGWAKQIACRTGIPVVVKLHGPAFMSLVEEELDTEEARLKIIAEGKALQHLPVIISPARRTLDDTLARYQLTPRYSQHVVNPLVLPHGAPLWTLEGCDRKTILFVGRFDKRKGGDLVLHAFAKLLAVDPQLKLLFVGPDAGVRDHDGRLVHFDAMKTALFSNAASVQITNLGKRTPDEIYRVRPRALVTVVASRWENQSYTALEAMLQGCPIISSDTGGQSEIVRAGYSGLLCKAGSVDSLVSKLQELLANPARAAEMGRAARSYVLEEHAPSRVARQTLEAYDVAIAAASPPR